MPKYPFVILAVVIIGLWKPGLGSAFLNRIEACIERLGTRPVLAMASIAILSILVSWSFSLFLRLPEPRVHDEFSYLLAADTFAHGRLTNPPHPLWEFLETFHVIQRPTYASKFPPATGAVLALGKVFFGSCLVGVWLFAALAAAAVLWMLLAWVPPKWAVLGGLMAALHPQVLLWNWGYWGGTVAMAGGAVVLGAFRRTVDRPSGKNGLLMGVGMGALANSRPFEGMILSLFVVGALLYFFVKRRSENRLRDLARVAIPMVSVVAAVLCFVGYYNFRVTGTPFRMPYMIHEAQYAAAPVFLWMKPQPMPVHLHRVIADAHATALRYYYKQQTIRGFVAELWVRLLYFKLYLWHYIPALFLPGLFIAVKRDIFPRLALVTWVGVVCVTIFQTWLLPHYLAPILPLEIALILFGMIEVEKWTWRGKPSGRFIVRITAFMLCGLSITFFCISRVKHEKYDSWEYDRPLVIHRLEKLEGQHLVVVKYQPNHNGFREWVYNGADIDGSKVVFAQDMGAERNARLIDYFQARKLWILDPDASPPDLQPYERN